MIKSYAVAWVDSSTKLRTLVDRVGGQDPTWNDKFLFKVSSEFLLRKTSTISVEIYAVGMFRDRLLGSVRLLISTFLQTASITAMRTPSFVARLIRSPSGEFFGTLNIGGMVLDGSGPSGFQLASLSNVSAIDYRGLTGKKHHPGANKSKPKVIDVMEFIPGDQSEAADPVTSSPSSSPLPTALRDLKERNNEEDLNGVGTSEQETFFEAEEEDEVSSIHFEQPLSELDLVSGKTAEEMVSDNEGSVVKMEKDVKKTMEENKQLKEMVEMLMVEAKEQSTVISDLTGRVRNLEKKLSNIKLEQNLVANGKRLSAWCQLSDLTERVKKPGEEQRNP